MVGGVWNESRGRPGWSGPSGTCGASVDASEKRGRATGARLPEEAQEGADAGGDGAQDVDDRADGVEGLASRGVDGRAGGRAGSGDRVHGGPGWWTEVRDEMPLLTWIWCLSKPLKLQFPLALAIERKSAFAPAGYVRESLARDSFELRRIGLLQARCRAKPPPAHSTSKKESARAGHRVSPLSSDGLTPTKQPELLRGRSYRLARDPSSLLRPAVTDDQFAIAETWTYKGSPPYFYLSNPTQAEAARYIAGLLKEILATLEGVVTGSALIASRRACHARAAARERLRHRAGDR